MNTNELIRELLEVLEVREWDHWGINGDPFCDDCEADARCPVHSQGCRYVAAVKAAREFLATPPVVGIRSWTVEQPQQFVETPNRKPRVWIDGQEVLCDSVKIDWQFDFPVFGDSPVRENAIAPA